MENLDRLIKYAEKRAIKRQYKYYKKLISGSESVLFLISPMSSCNMRCMYCFIEGYNSKKEKTVLDANTIGNIVDMIIDFKNRNPLAIVSISLHGYEPLQVDNEVLYLINDKIKKSGWHTLDNELGKAIELGVQTNGLLLTEDRIRFFYKNQWRVSVSLDGPRDVHNYSTQSKSYDTIMDNLRIYEKYFGRKPAIISVWTKKHLEIGPEGYYEWLKSEGFVTADLHWVSVSPKNPYYNKILPDNLQEVVNYFKKLFDLWSEDSSGINLYPFSGMVEALVRGRATGRMCLFRAGCHRIIEFSYDGHIRSCDRGAYVSTYKINEISKIEDVLLDIDFHKELHMRPIMLKHLNKRCSNCKYFNICLGGCPSESTKKWERASNCYIYKELYSYIENRLIEAGYELGI